MSALRSQVFLARLLGCKNLPHKLHQRGFKYETTTIEDEQFRVLVIPGHTVVKKEEKKERRAKREVPPPRFKSMPVDQDWTAAWPTAKSVTWSTLPIPVRMGYVEKSENGGLIPSAYGNAELMKIPNFLHLTPEHIRKQCAAIKKFCNPWPKELDSDEKCTEHFPITVTTCDYVFDGPSVKDERARVVTIKVNLSSLNLDYHGRDKFIRLAGKSYDKITDQVILQTDKCPMKKQNYDYLMYLLTALYKESCKIEPWESEKTLEDMEKYFWDINKSKKNLVDFVTKLKTASRNCPNVGKPLEELPDNPSEENILALDSVQKYKDSVERMMSKKDDINDIQEYKNAVKQLLGLE